MCGGIERITKWQKEEPTSYTNYRVALFVSLLVSIHSFLVLVEIHKRENYQTTISGSSMLESVRFKFILVKFPKKKNWTKYNQKQIFP